MAILISIVAFAFAIIFKAWSLGHGVWDWQLFMLIGLLFLAVAGWGGWPAWFTRRQ